MNMTKVNTISAVTIGKLIEAHMEQNEEKFLSYATFIAETYEKAGMERSTRIIRSRINGTYKDQPKVVLDLAPTGVWFDLITS